MDDKDRMRLMIEVEREMADLEQENKKRMNLTKTSNMSPNDEELLQVNDKDFIGTDEMCVGTGEEFEFYLRTNFGKRMRVKEVQTDKREGMKQVSVSSNVHDLGIMIEASTETNPVNITSAENHQQVKKGGK